MGCVCAGKKGAECGQGGGILPQVSECVKSKSEKTEILIVLLCSKNFIRDVNKKAYVLVI